jgi:hypothetical protein
MVIQNGIIKTVRNRSVNVPAEIKNNQMKNPITCADVVRSIMEVLIRLGKNRKNPVH